MLGQEAGGAFIGGLRYGEGEMYTRNAGRRRIFWQGPSLGFDAGADGDRTMMLVYGLPAVDAHYQRFGGVDGSAYLIGGFGFTALTAGDVVVVPVRSGVGARLGLNLGYLKFTLAIHLEPVLTSRRFLSAIFSGEHAPQTCARSAIGRSSSRVCRAIFGPICIITR